MRNPAVFAALLFAVVLSTGCRGAIAPGGLEASKWQPPTYSWRKTAAAKQPTVTSTRTQQKPNYSVHPASHVASVATIPDDYLDDPPPPPPTDDASSGLVRHNQGRVGSQTRAFSALAESAPIEQRQRRSTDVENSIAQAGKIAQGDAELSLRESSRASSAPRMLVPASDALPAAGGWNALPSEDEDANPLRAENDRPVVSTARWTYDRRDVQPGSRLRANPLRP